MDIAFDDLSNAKHYKEEEDPKHYKSVRTGRGPLIEGWRDDKPIMCSYKLVHASFEVWGLQTTVEDFIQKCIRDVLLLGHRQAFTWIDEWFDMSIDDVRAYEKRTQNETNQRVLANSTTAAADVAATKPATTEIVVTDTDTNEAQIVAGDSLDIVVPNAQTECS